ncbi:hypothetical protein [Planomicrobium okeanokoites]|uniref:hypothetical protein n=1 Tax=Planomicrobium okeanokoites TaxID=244 RepID=UPI00249078D4|nr:hypothetical protein [Planomicrobium okeanokoites]
MDRLVKEQLGEMLDVFESFPDCKIEKTEGDRLLIASHKPVPWSDSLENGDAGSAHKIGSINPHKFALGLYIDFPHDFFEFDELVKIVDPEATLTYYPPGEKTSTVKSWWRFRSDEKFDSIHLVLRKTELDYYDFKREDWMELMRQIIGVHK